MCFALGTAGRLQWALLTVTLGRNTFRQETIYIGL